MSSVSSGSLNSQDDKYSRKRDGYLEWSDYFMAIAFLSAQRSKDPRTQIPDSDETLPPSDKETQPPLEECGQEVEWSQSPLGYFVGACIVNEEKKIVGIGYNGMPNGCSDDNMPWGREGDNILNTKQLYVCHAELNAVLNKNSADVKNCTIYVALFPCNECAKIVIQAGIREVVYYSDKYKDKPEFQAAKRMFDMARVIYRQYRPIQQKIVIDFGTIDEMSNGVLADMERMSISHGQAESPPANANGPADSSANETCQIVSTS